MILFLVSGWINKIVKHLKLKLFLLVNFFLTVNFLKNINIFFKKFFSYLFIYINFFLYLISKKLYSINNNDIIFDRIL